MTLTELMIEHTPPRLVGTTHDHRAGGRWWGWLTRQFDWLEGHTDWHRKV